MGCIVSHHTVINTRIGQRARLILYFRSICQYLRMSSNFFHNFIKNTTNVRKYWFSQYNQIKKRVTFVTRFQFGANLLSHHKAVPSALRGLTSLFGMERGGSPGYSHLLISSGFYPVSLQFLQFPLHIPTTHSLR